MTLQFILSIIVITVTPTHSTHAPLFYIFYYFSPSPFLIIIIMPIDLVDQFLDFLYVKVIYLNILIQLLNSLNIFMYFQSKFLSAITIFHFIVMYRVVTVGPGIIKPREYGKFRAESIVLRDGTVIKIDVFEGRRIIMQSNNIQQHQHSKDDNDQQHQHSKDDQHSKEDTTNNNSLCFSQSFCITCNLFRPNGVSHCSFCNGCVWDKDHHCPSLNICIGRSNKRYFILFILTNFITQFISLIILVEEKRWILSILSTITNLFSIFVLGKFIYLCLGGVKAREWVKGENARFSLKRIWDDLRSFPLSI